MVYSSMNIVRYDGLFRHEHSKIRWVIEALGSALLCSCHILACKESALSFNRVSFQKKLQKLQNMVNIYICGSPFVMSRTDVQQRPEHLL